MPRGNYWYSNLETNDPKMKEDFSKYMKMYRLIKSDIRHLTSELAGNTAQPDESRACYRALHRIFNGKSITRSKEAARLMLALGDPDLLRALKRRYPKQHCSGSIDIQRRAEKSDAKKVHANPVGRMEKAGDVIHTVFSEAEVDQRGSNSAQEHTSVMKRINLVENEPRHMIVYNESTGNARKRSSESGENLGETILLQESSFLVNEDRMTCRNSAAQNVNRTQGANGLSDPSNSRNSEDLTSSTAKTGNSPLKKDMELAEETKPEEWERAFRGNYHIDLSAQSVQARNDSVLTVLDKAGNAHPLCHLSRLCASPIPKDFALDQNAVTWNSKLYPRPSSGPAILVSDNSFDQKKRVLHLTSLHHRPGAIHLPDGRISIPASLPKLAPTTVINRVNSLQELSQMSSRSVAKTRKGMAPIGMMGSVSQPDDYELSEDILEELYVVKQHRRSFFADGNSLVEVRPRSMPTAPTLIATHTSEGKFNVPADIESNRRAILVINAMKKSVLIDVGKTSENYPF